MERCNDIVISHSHFSGETVSTRSGVCTGDEYHLGKCGPTGLSQTGPLEEEEGEGKFPQIRQCLDMILSETQRMTRMNGPVTTSSTVFLKV
jgi:hypothetical protein